MKEIKILPISKESEEKSFADIQVLFKDLYNYMQAKGLVLRLVENGEQLWMKSIKSTLGKLSMIYAAYQNGKMIGFVTGILRISPAYLGNKKIGYLSHLYISPEYRRGKLGKQLTKAIEGWFIEKKVDQIEVEIITGNSNSLNFFTKLGYEDDIIKKTKHAKISQ